MEALEDSVPVEGEAEQAPRPLTDHEIDLGRKLYEDVNGTLYADRHPLVRGILYRRFYGQLGRVEHSAVLRAYYDIRDRPDQ